MLATSVTSATAESALAAAVTDEELRRQVTRGTVFQLSARVIGWALSLAAGGIIARTLGPAGFGIYSLAILVGSTVAVCADLGLSAMVLRELSRRPDDPEFVGGILWFKTITQLGVFLVIAPLAVLALHRVAPVSALAIGLVVAALGIVVGTLQLPAQRRVRFEATALADVAGRLVQLIAVIVVVAMGAGLLPLLTAALLVPIGALLIVGRSAHRQLASWRGRFAPAERWALLKSSLPLGLVLVLGLLHFKVDSLLIAWLRPSRELGLYSADYRVIEVLLAFPALIVTTAFPVLSRVSGNDLHRWVRRALAALWVSGLVMVAPLFVYAHDVVAVVAGRQYLAAVPALRVLLVATLFAWLNTLFAQLAVVLNVQRRILIASVIGLSTNLLVNLAVIPRWGYAGAAWVTVGSEALGFAMVSFIVCQASGQWYLRTKLWALTVAAAGAAGLAEILPSGPPRLVWVGGCVLLAAVAVALRVRTRSDGWLSTFTRLG